MNSQRFICLIVSVLKGGLLICVLTQAGQANAAKRIVSLAPHTTELIYALGEGQHLLAVSEFSNYPAEASLLPTIANFNGVDFEAIVRLQPDLIVAWQGGNKPQDLARLESMGYPIYYSSPQSPGDIARDIVALGKVLHKNTEARQIAARFSQQLDELSQRYQSVPVQRGFYYMWTSPLMSVGPGAWANQLLEICAVHNIFADSPIAYPEVSLEQVIRKQPQLVIAAMKTSLSAAQQYWQAQQDLLKARVIVADPDELHRFTPRLIAGLNNLCKQINGF